MSRRPKKYLIDDIRSRFQTVALDNKYQVFMESYIYLIQNGDLFNIGVSTNLDKAKQLLNPGQVCSYMKIKYKDSEILCKNLQSRYSDVRIPQTDYFRLSKSQLLECQLMMKSEGGEKYFEPIFKGLNLIVTFLLAWLLLSGLIINLAVNPILNIIL